MDHRLGEFCSTGADVRVPEIALASLPIEMLPLVLLGRLPVSAPLADPSAPEAETEVFDESGGRWTARMAEGRVQSWTLWSGDKPSLWWLAQPKGGILSHHGGSQFRWRESVEEPLEPGAETLEPPDGYPRVECGDWGPAI